jgi:hypothetical protein
LSLDTSDAVREQAKWKVITDNVSERVGEVIFGTNCAGSCVAVFFQNKMYVITCRHVTFCEDIEGIPLYHLQFKFKRRAYRWKQHFSYLGSCPGLDLCFFIMNDDYADVNRCFQIECQPLHTGTDIVIAGFPTAPSDMEEPKCMKGTVSSSGYLSHFGVSDISSTLPNVSGGAVFSLRCTGRYLAGIHLGVYRHKDETNKVESKDKKSSAYYSTTKLTTDTVFETEDKIPASMSVSKSISPVINLQKYADDNIGHKGSLAYYVTVVPIVNLLAPEVNEQIRAKMVSMAQSQSKNKRFRPAS